MPNNYRPITRIAAWYQPYKSGFTPEPRLQAQRCRSGAERDGAGLLVVVLLYIPLSLPGFLHSRHNDGAREGFRRETLREAVQVGMGGSTVKQGAGGYGEKHISAMETRGLQDQPPERQRRLGGQLAGLHTRT